MWYDLFFSGGGWIGGLAGLGTFLFILLLFKSIIKVNLPDKLLVVTGRKRRKGERTFGFSVERGRTVKIPYFQSVADLDLGVIPINVRVEGVNSANGITVGADATACVCIDDDDEAMIYQAVERLMGKSREEIQKQIQQTLVGNFRGALNKTTPLQAIGMEESWNEEEADNDGQIQPSGERAHFRIELLKDCNQDLASFGMKVVSVSLQKIWDTSNYIGNLAQKTLAQKRQQVEIEEARLRSLAEKAESDSIRRINVARNKADEEILKAREKLEVYRREAAGQTEKAKLEADQSIVEAKNRAQTEIQTQLVEVQILRNQSGVTLEADARAQAAQILGTGEKEAIRIAGEARNSILRQKVEIIEKAGKVGQTVMFLQEQLPHLFNSFRNHARATHVDSLVVMDEEKGLSGAVNRGPSAFVDFLAYLEKGFGVDVKSFIVKKEEQA